MERETGLHVHVDRDRATHSRRQGQGYYQHDFGEMDRAAINTFTEIRIGVPCARGSAGCRPWLCTVARTAPRRACRVRVEGLGLRDSGLLFMVYGLWLRVDGLGLRV